MMRHHNKGRRIGALLLLLLAGAFTICNTPLCEIAYAAEAEEDAKVIEIASVRDFNSFARKCRANTWSDGMTVNLSADLDFRGETFTSIAYFNGRFNGNSHRISNIGNGKPLFQTIGPFGIVRDLELTSNLTSTGDNTAAFVSRNGGTLERIRVAGKVKGKVTTGILAAVNEAGGQIISCEVLGSVSGESATGGIAGKNLGTISSCVNHAYINTTVNDDNLSTDDIKAILENILLTKSFNSMDNLRAQVDNGGIAGYNQGGGLITDCVNEGVVGYPHVGYNTGGICGRNGGAVENCVNRGTVYGRKDVGGIAGQQQPEISVDFAEDVLESLSKQMDDINLLITDTLNTSTDITNSTYDRLSGISKTMTDVKNSTNVIYDASVDRFDEIADSVNYNTGVVTDSVGDIAAATDDLTESMDTLDTMCGNLESSIDSLEYAFGMTNAEKAELLNTGRRLREDLNATSGFVNEVQNNLLPEVPEERSARVAEGISQINRLVQDIRAMRTILGRLRGIRDRIASGSLQVEEARRERALSSSVSDILDAVDDLDDAVILLGDFSSSLGGSLYDMSRGLDISLQKNDTVRAAGQDVFAGLDTMSSQMDSLNAYARDESLEVIGNLQEINNKFDGMMDLLKNERDRLNNLADDKDVFVDQSDVSDSPARIYASRNEADVYGDLTTGGIAGTIGIEYDVDPENDVVRSNDRSLDYTFGVSAVIADSENDGRVEGRGNYTGGIIGKMDLGRVRSSRNTGDVRSESGDFTGGIAGYSEGTIDGSSARCRVSGGRNTGGIAGYGKTLRDNSAVVAELTGAEYTGAIAGRVNALDSQLIQRNLYYAGAFGGIDDIDYASMAEKASAPMDMVLVKFMVRDRLLGMEEVKAGTALKDVGFPEPEAREGFLLIWDKDGETVLEEDTVVTGSYRLAVSVLNSEERWEGTSKPLLMADGAFREEDKLDFTLLGENHYRVVIPEDGNASRKVRVHRPSSKRYRLLVNGAETPAEAFGDYLTFETEEREMEILIEKTGLPAEYIGGGAAALAALLAVLSIAGARKKRREGEKTDESGE